ncbi:MAG: hypothetical protein ABSE48_02525 [Verrucomicrobiota bacterium]
MKSLGIIVATATLLLAGIGCESNTAANGASPMAAPDSFSGTGSTSSGAGGK